MKCNDYPLLVTLISRFESGVSPRESAGFIPKKSYKAESGLELKGVSSADFKDQATVTEREVS